MEKRRRISLRDALVISQLAMSMVLLICAALICSQSATGGQF